MAQQVEAAEQIQLIDLSKLEVHPANPRQNVGDVSDIASSIESIGQLSPLLAVRHNGTFQVVDGSRRLAALKKAGKTQAHVRVIEADEAEAAAIAIISNIQRAELSPLEEAGAYSKWLQLTGKTQAELAKAVGRAPSTIANALRLLDAAPAIQKALAKGDITAAHAKAAMSLPEGAVDLLEFRKDMSVRDLEDDVKAVKRAYDIAERIRRVVETYKAKGQDVTWSSKPEYYQGSQIDLVKALGQPPKNVAGRITDWLNDLPGGVYGMQGSVTVHDSACDCRAIAVANTAALVERVCVSPSGWRKYREALAKTSRSRSGRTKKKVLSAAAKQAAAERELKVSIADATKALEGKSISKYKSLKLDAPAQLLAGGLGGEPARLALFGYVAEFAEGKGKTWKVELWKQIEKLALKDVRDRVTQWAVAMGLEQIDDARSYSMNGSGPRNDLAIRELVNEHYGVKAKKKAKR